MDRSLAFPSVASYAEPFCVAHEPHAAIDHGFRVLTLRERLLLDLRSIHFLLALVVLACASCTVDGTAPEDETPVEPRTYAMGWSPIPPRLDTELLLRMVDSMAVVSEIAIVQEGVPWEALLAGAPMDSLVEDRAQITDFILARGMDLMFLVDPLDGLDRTQEDPELTDLGRSVLEPEIRAMHEDWVRRVASRMRPSYFGLASEINTLAAGGAPELNAVITDLINTLAPQVRQISPQTQVFVSFQADQANGRLGQTGGIDHFALIDDYDIDALGLSSYPVFAFDDPSEIPADYFDAFDAATDLPLLFVEGGWSSEDVPWSSGTPAQQIVFFQHYEQLLDAVNAEVWVMLTCADLDVASFGLDAETTAGLSNFAFMGIVGPDLKRKPSYEEWEGIFARPRN